MDKNKKISNNSDDSDLMRFGHTVTLGILVKIKKS